MILSVPITAVLKICMHSLNHPLPRFIANSLEGKLDLGEVPFGKPLHPLPRVATPHARARLVPCRAASGASPHNPSHQTSPLPIPPSSRRHRCCPPADTPAHNRRLSGLLPPGRGWGAWATLIWRGGKRGSGRTGGSIPGTGGKARPRWGAEIGALFCDERRLQGPPSSRTHGPSPWPRGGALLFRVS